MDDETLEVPLPEGTMPDQESVTTQEIRIPSDPFPDVKLVSPVKVDLPPVHLLGDPIMTMEAPRADETPLYDQIHGPRKKRPAPRMRRRMKTGDKVLAGMGAASIVGITIVYGMVAYGWGGGSMPEEAAPESSTIQVTTPSETPMDSPTPRHTPSPERKKTSAPAAAPETYLPEPEYSVIVVVAPEPTPTPTKTSEAPSAPETTSRAPEPTETSESPSASASSSPPASPSPSQSSPSASVSTTEESSEEPENG